MRKDTLLTLGTLLCLGLAAAAQASPSPQALRLAPGMAAPQVDGALDEPAWRLAPVHDRFVQFLPEDGQPAPARWRTTVQVLVEADALVFGIRAYDDEPARIRAPLTRRDQVKRDQDFVSIVLDPVGLRRSAQFVRINAAGVLGDGLFTADDDVEDFAPDFDVQAAARRLPDGYSIELRWPLAALRFPHANGETWRLMVTRSVPRESSHLYVSAPLTREALNFIAELQPLEGLGDLAETVRERSFLSLRPELTLRGTRASGPDGRRRKDEASLGAELKWRPRADWVLDATLNPDFSQVELDTPQLAGNTRFALSVPEKRPFFLESTDIAGTSQPDDVGTPRALSAFYSRAITDPDWGLRATWRGAQAQATLMQLRDAGGGEVLRAHAYGTASYRQPADSTASIARARMHLGAWGLGALASSRDYGGGRSNRVLGGEASWQLGPQDLLRGQLLFSRTSVGFDALDEHAFARPAQSGHDLWLGWMHRSEDWNNSAHYEQVSARFANDNGFVPQSGFRRATAHLHRRLGAQDLAPFPVYESELQLKLQRSETLADAEHGVARGELLMQRLQPGIWFTSARNIEVWSHLGLDAQRARQGGALHRLRTLTAGFGGNPAPWLTWLSAELEWGRRLDVEADRVGRGAWLLIEAKLRQPLPRGWWLEFEQHAEQGFVRGPESRRAFRDLALQSLLVLHVSARDSLRLIGQNSRYQRRAEPARFEAANERDRNFSLVAQHRQSLNRVFSLGLSRARAWPSDAKQTELFAKAVFGYP
ncbi:carbohydrate binding family 9 domain-containing protein [Roseateles sp. DAIF2]|uniref:carbohydrate binding family 9 domain-containing protein n=1 Tax=Roseateles sp. DAIF2 TaxID=2714952 RepID=UPI0018A27374|nr:carbohydrate binding family 9 domain-containing protein [Roseateles sp. DAIF2]QPF76313.1 carbohydrate binding family 9 domain-containing protein [Roseateles sp. DAIF2]